MNTGITDAAVVPGTARITDLVALAETVVGQDLGGCRIAGVMLRGNIGAFTAGAQSFTYAMHVGSDSLDAADLLPSTIPHERWWGREVILHRGTSHQLTAANESDNIRIRRYVRGPRVIGQFDETLWFAEEAVAQTQNAFWNIRLRIEMP